MIFQLIGKGSLFVEQTIGNHKLILEVGDISEVKTNAIVNPVNGRLSGGGTVDEAIRSKAGEGLDEECADIFKNQLNNEQLPTGQAIITSGFDLPVQYIIHTRGPVWNGEKDESEAELAETYKNCLLLAKEHDVTSIAFPSISTGIYHFPINLAAHVALKTVVDFLKQEDFGDVVFTLFSKRSYEVYANELKELMK